MLRKRISSAPMMEHEIEEEKLRQEQFMKYAYLFAIVYSYDLCRQRKKFLKEKKKQQQVKEEENGAESTEKPKKKQSAKRIKTGFGGQHKTDFSKTSMKTNVINKNKKPKTEGDEFSNPKPEKQKKHVPMWTRFKSATKHKQNENDTNT